MSKEKISRLLFSIDLAQVVYSAWLIGTDQSLGFVIIVSFRWTEGSWLIAPHITSITEIPTAHTFCSYIIHCIYCAVTKYQFYFIICRALHCRYLLVCVLFLAFSKFFAYIAHFIAYLSDFIEIMWPPSAKSNLNWAVYYDVVPYRVARTDPLLANRNWQSSSSTSESQSML